MPKIIENLPQRLLEEARRQCEELGYSNMNIRSVAKNCGVSVGSVYNCYPNKDALIAAFIQADWKECMEASKANFETAEDALRSAYDGLCQFLKRNEKIFQDAAATLLFSGSGSQYNNMVRQELAALVRPFCRDEATAKFVSASLTFCVVEGVVFEELSSVLLRLL